MQVTWYYKIIYYCNKNASGVIASEHKRIPTSTPKGLTEKLYFIKYSGAASN